ncbi:alpha-L-fucosidase [Streptomyces sp. NPDC087440]|uniref:alpha-L-fucosidase n=1 Tax=Streptomyces sp. NPDC087440 TaxID=3365790 RepID=UPI0038125D97
MRKRYAAVVAGLAALALAAPTAVQANPAGHGRPGVGKTPDYQPTYASLATHPVPQWFNDAKLGIFIHWGAYAIPAWAVKGGWPAGSPYSEWYWKEMNRPNSPAQLHHKEKYGTAKNYDDFVKEWKAPAFDAKKWLGLFKDGGAKYYTLVTKHHDGVALWDTATSDRNTVKLGPGRDFVKELVETNKKGGYGLKNGFYYSMPEWFHPNMPKIGGGWFGDGAPRNPYTKEPLPYTGYKPVKDYVKDHQFPQLKELVDRFDPDLIWCDIGLENVNNSEEFNAYYFNQAKNRRKPKEVAVDDRCGTNVPADFTTPEYSVEPDIKTAKWEASRGLGQSYGYNENERPEDYLTSAALISNFVDVVSKNGNLLLNLGPRADGSMDPAQEERVRDLGAWLKVNGEAIYGSRYWTQAEDKGANVPVRFTTQPEAFYATALKWPGAELKLTAQVPLGAHDEIRLVGDRGGKALKWTKNADGSLSIDTSQLKDTGAHAYTFRIARPGYRADRAMLLGVQTPAVTANQGERITVPVEVANRGDKHLPGGLAKVSVPGAKPVWLTTPALDAHTRVTLKAQVTVGRTVAPGDYRVKVETQVRGKRFDSSSALSVLGEMTRTDLSALYDNDGIATAGNPKDGNFDTAGSTYPAEELPKAGVFQTPQRVPFTWPATTDGTKNNVVLSGQSIPVTPGKYRKLHLLASAAFGGGGKTSATVTYADGSTQQIPMAFPDWLSAGGLPVAVKATYRYNADGTKGTGPYINLHSLAVDPAKEVRSVTLARPTGNNARVNLHLWGLTAEK